MIDINNNNKTTMLEKLKLLTYAAFAYLNVDSEPFFILMVLMCIDTLLGAVKAVRLGQKFNFRTMLIGYMMKLCFLIIPLTVALMGKALGYDFHHPVSITYLYSPFRRCTLFWETFMQLRIKLILIS